HGGILYKRSYGGPHLHCVTKEEGRYVLREMHEGCCSDHNKSGALVARILRAGYFWPRMREDAKAMVKKCLQCQKHGPLIHQPAEAMTTMSAPIPFAQWGIDLVGPMLQGTGQRKFLIVAVDYFTKWVEAEPLAKITEEKVIKFLYNNICCRFGVPKVLISDNGTQFNGKRIRAWCEDMRIEQHFASVAHPQANGQVEVTNRIILNGLKTKCEPCAKKRRAQRKEAKRRGLRWVQSGWWIPADDCVRLKGWDPWPSGECSKEVGEHLESAGDEGASTSEKRASCLDARKGSNKQRCARECTVDDGGVEGQASDAGGRARRKAVVRSKQELVA
ncbi:Unknown protein, partial [Striga hermonthica]